MTPESILAGFVLSFMAGFLTMFFVAINISFDIRITNRNK